MNTKIVLANKRLALSLCMTLFSVICFAQDEVTSKVVKTTTTTSTWYAQPWVWVVGAAVFILLLVALFRGGSSTSDRTESVTLTKTTSTDV